METVRKTVTACSCLTLAFALGFGLASAAGEARLKAEVERMTKETTRRKTQLEMCTSLLEHANELKDKPVSYTHLTLPTICSV